MHQLHQLGFLHLIKRTILIHLMIISLFSTISLSLTTRMVAKVSYDGSKFYGFQRGSKDTRTCQSTLEEKLSKYFNYPDLKVVAASRTDRGVHAYGQVIHFDIPIRSIPDDCTIPDAITLTQAINCTDLIITQCNIAPTGLLPIQISDGLPFHAITNAKYKHYKYKFIINDNVKIDPFDRNYIADIHHHIRIKRKSYFDINKFKQCLALFVGTHDFKAFGNQLKKRSDLVESYKNETFNSNRTIYNITVNEEKRVTFGDNDTIYSVDFFLNGAMYKMIRNIMQAAIEVAYGETSLEYVSHLLTNCTSRDDSSILTAPACGLYLVNVYYDEVLFS